MKSIQAEAKRTSGKSHVAKLNDKTLRTASRKGLAWNDDEVAILATMIGEDKTTYEMALATSRTLLRGADGAGARGVRDAPRGGHLGGPAAPSVK